MSMTERKTGGLGRGLASLIPPRPAGTPDELPIARIRRNPYQPRRSADVAQLEALAASIREHGVLQPIIVVATVEGYQLIAGERRLRAAELAGLTHVPAVVREAGAADQLELALVENLQRADLDPIEEARAFRRLIDVEAGNDRVYDVECLFPDRKLPIPLGDLESATPICNACTAPHIFRPDED